jgi:tetratricopeptide (TPR) repeat protein/CO dehydrogenase nickel-insertion accessory protein CooC1
MTDTPQGQVVTFYSYKGGTGRTMAVANVGWILAAAGKRVLVADWDLESPGLHRFFTPFMNVKAVASMGGVIDLIREFEEEVKHPAERPEGWVNQLARVEDYAFSLDWTFPDGGSLDFLSAGRQNDTYAQSLCGLDWDNFYERLHGQQFLDALRQNMIEHYDYTLIDSRTGFSDVSDICTGHLPDVLVDCFTLSTQGITGAAQIARKIRNQKVRGRNRSIRVLPVAMRVDQAEKEKADSGRRLAMRSFPGLPPEMSEPERARYFNRVEVPYRPYFAYEETLATFGEEANSVNTLLAAYEHLTAVITDGDVKSLTPMEESLRLRWQRAFVRSGEEAPTEYGLDYIAEDQNWAEWITDVLSSAGIAVVDPGPIGIPAPENTTAASQTLAVVSPGYLEARRSTPRETSWTEPAPLSIYIADVSSRRTSETATLIAGLSEKEAAERVLRLVGEAPGAGERELQHTSRFPGTEPTWFEVPAPHARFTGRVADLYQIRNEMRSTGAGVVQPVVLQGMGGIGKSQLAQAYAYRFKSSYDLIWWIPADPPQFIDTTLSDLGVELELPAQRTAAEAARAVLKALRQGSPTTRWLLIYDNADDLAEVERFLPQGGPGHVLLTSRNPDWGNRARTITVDVFHRQESVAHLRGRVPTMERQQAEQVADAVGDLPIAVALAGAWLAETGTPVQDYLNLIEQDGVKALSLEAVWGLSLDRLAERSPAANRLLQLCSLLAPETALSLLYSDQFAEHLVAYDPAVEDRLMRGSLIQHISRLGLLKLDGHAARVEVHRLLQDVVRRRMSPEELDDTKHQTHLILAKSRPNGEVEDPATWASFRPLWPHLGASEASSCTDESVRALLVDRVRYLWRRGDYTQGENFGLEVAATWQQRLSELDPDGTDTDPGAAALHRQLLLLQFNIANILRDQARFKEALTLDEQILEQQSKLVGPQHPHTLMTSGSRAADLRALGRYAEALPLEKEIYLAWKEQFGDEHPRTLSAANNLATSLRSVGDFRQAEEIDEKTWKTRRYVLDPDHPYTLHSGNNLGRDRREAGQYDKSIALLRDLLTLAQSERGPDSTEALNIQTNLAVSLRSAGKAGEAAPLLDAAFEAFTARFAQNNPDTLACRLNRAANLLACGRPEPALRETIAVTAEYIKSLGERHPFSLMCLSNQSAIHHHNRDYAHAYALVSEAADGCIRALGPSHPYSLATGMNLAICEYNTDQAERALGRAEELASRMRVTLGQHHPDTLTGQVNRDMLSSLAQDKDARGLGGEQASESPAFNELCLHLGQEHPTIKELRAGWLAYRVIDPHEPF